MSDPHAPSHVPVSIQHPHLNIDFTAHAVDQIHSSPCNIGGWDAAVIISIAELNKGIASAHSFPASFSHTGLDGTEAKMSGSFSNWRVGSGGSASILHMHVSLSTTTLEYNGQTLDLSGATIVIELKLEFTKGSHSPKTEELKIRQTPNPASSPCLSVISLLLPGDNTIGFLAKAVFSGLMNDWLNSNLALFTHTFGVVTLNTDPDDLYAWLKPSLAGYAFADSAGSEDAAFAILSMTGDHGQERGANLIPQLSTGELSSKSPAKFIIGPSVLIKQLLGVALPGVFEASTPADFEFIGSTQIRNKNPLILPDIGPPGKNFPGTIDAQWFTLTLDTNGLVLSIPNLKIQYAPGIDISFDLEEHLNVVLRPRKSGGHALWLEQTKCVCTHQIHCSLPGTSVKDVIKSILPFIEKALGLLPVDKLGTKLSNISMQMLGALSASLKTGQTPKLRDTTTFAAYVAANDFDSLPDFDTPVIKALQCIQWLGCKNEAKIISGSLNGQLTLVIDPGFSD